MKTKKLWFSAAVNLLGLLFLVLILKPCFEMNDDSTIYELTGGAKGVYDAHGVFLHLFLGQAMKLLSGLFPGIQWYTALQYAVLFCSFTAVFYVLMNRMKPAMAAASFGVLFFYFGYEGYIILQFSKTSGIASCAGIFLMFHGLEQKKKNWLCVSCGLLLALVGGMYRYKEFLMCAAVMSSLGVYTLFRLNWKRSRELFYTVLAYLGSFLLLFGSFGGLLLFQSFAYEKDEAWGEYLRYNDSRSSLMDYGFPDYDTFQEEYEKLGLSREDIELYRSGNYADPDLFDSEAIETLLSLRPKKELNRSFLLDYFDTFPLGFLNLYVFSCFLLLCFFWLFFGKKTWKEILALGYGAAVIGGIYAYLFYIGRYLVSRTETALWLGACLLVLWLLEKEKTYFSLRTAAAFCAFALVFQLPSWKEQMRGEKKEISNQMKINQEYLQLAGADREHLYLAKLNTLTTFSAYGPFDVIPYDSLTNLWKLGGWESGNPTEKAVLESYGVTNPYRDLINNPKVIVTDQDVKETLRYLREHYDPDVKAYLIKDINGQSFYVFRSLPFEPEKETGIRDADGTMRCEVQLGWGKKNLTVSGTVYQENTNSYTQMVYLSMKQTETGEKIYYPLTIAQAYGVEDLRNGRFGSVSGTISLDEYGISKEAYEEGVWEFGILVENENGVWRGEIS